MSGFIVRQERFDVVGSTNDVVRDWLADGVPEVCLAIADRQTAGRGRDGRSWVAPGGAALLLSLGFRPRWLAPEQAWRLAAIVSLAMADAAETAAGLDPGAIRLKWPNDLAVETDSGVRKLAGVLGETDGLGTDRPTAVIGIGVNTNWAATDFPPELAASMTSLVEISRERLIDHDAIREAFVRRLEEAVNELRSGTFDGGDWAARQVTTDRWVRLEFPDGKVAELPAVGVDDRSGALIVVDPAIPDVRRHLLVGEIQHVRLAGPIAAGV